jgi:hypothetical protein
MTALTSLATRRCVRLTLQNRGLGKSNRLPLRLISTLPNNFEKSEDFFMESLYMQSVSV